MNRKARLFTIVPPFAIAYVLWVFRPPQWDATHVAGMALTVFGIGLLTLARYQLGNAFSITPQATTLVTTGLYSRIRNPVYFFGAIGIAGFILYLGRPRVLLIFLILIPMQIFRAHQEALVLEAKFGDQYRSWRKQTWF